MNAADVLVVSIALCAALALVRLGGGLYETGVIDPAWPGRPELVQPRRGGIARKRFWIPAHSAFEVTLLASLAAAWPATDIRFWLLTALVSHAVMRVWSALDLIPKALAFERTDPATIDEAAARRWTRRSRLRLPFDLAACAALLAGLVAAARLG